MKTYILIIAIIIFQFGNLFSQQSENDDSIVMRPVQLGFVSPLGTNGLQSWDVANHFSLNIFMGYSGGLSGAEIGGFYNQTRGSVEGLQIAGFANTTLGRTVGCQIAGFSNVNKKYVSGLQIGGFTNIVTGNVNAAQISGFTNITSGDLKGFQCTGFNNYSGSMSSGAQIAGFSNVNKGDGKGLQIAGFSNISGGDLTGVQISGFVNMAKNVKGAQIGFINLADSVDGISLGFLSIVKKGYRAFEISGNESMYTVSSFKTGTEMFYNIISIGAKLQHNEILWGWGYGFGTIFPVQKNIKVNVDAVSYHINEDRMWTGKLNMLNKLNIAANYRINDYISVFGGFTWNVKISDTRIYDNEIVFTSLEPWSVYDKTRRNTNITMYPGFCFGIRF